MISKSTVDEVLLRNDIESLIGGYVSLKRSGSNLKGLCPFHSEKTPSFQVYAADNSFYCFGCGMGGNAITFIRQIEHLDFEDAIEFLAKRAGITVIRENEKEYTPRSSLTRDKLYKMNVDAAKFFHKMLFADNPDSKAALDYFTEKRKLSLATIKHFGLGYAPNGFDTLLKYMLQKGYTREELFEAFLASKSDKGHYYDSFRNRVMFPIIDPSGNVIAFGGRIMDASTANKYKNSTDTLVFKKSRNLFALNFAKNSAADQLILCEGYMDVIALHAAGFTNAVATLGTAITPEQARLMTRYTKKVAICYDADAPGQKAAQKAIKLLSDVGLEVGVIKIPGAKDPDEYIKQFGKEKFADVLSSTKTKFEYNLDSVLAKHDINIPQSRINALNELEDLISTVYSAAERDIYIQSISKTFSVDASSIKEDVARILRKKANAQRKKDSEELKMRAVGYSDKVNPDFSKAPSVASNEENVLGLLLIYPEHQKSVFENSLLSSNDFFTAFNKRVFEYIEASYKAGSPEEIPDANAVFTPEEIGRITKMKLSRMGLTENNEAVLRESIQALKESLSKKAVMANESIDDLQKYLDAIRKKEAKG